jgi:RimJ/RimL family protein N-acetyltransferase
VVLGGGAPHLPAVAELIGRLNNDGKRIHLFQDVAEMARLMMAADLCIGAPGTTTWERCCLGLPCLLIGIAENQRPNAEITAGAGAAKICGFLTTDTRTNIAENLQNSLQSLIAAPSDLQQMSQAASRLSDGRGVDRILLGCLPSIPLSDGGQLSIRLAEPADEQCLLNWQQAPATRRYAINPQIPTPADHHDWFERKLLSTSDWFLIAEIAGEPVGYLRLDWHGDRQGMPIYLVSIATAPGHYRRGIASAMLHLARELAPAAAMVARILPGNKASIDLFRGLGYAERLDGCYWSTTAA